MTKTRKSKKLKAPKFKIEYANSRMMKFPPEYALTLVEAKKRRENLKKMGYFAVIHEFKGKDYMPIIFTSN